MDIFLKDYAHLIENGDSTLAVLCALRAAQDGDTLRLGGGELHFRPDRAFTKEYYISNNDYNLKPIAFPLLGRRGLTVDGEGTRLVFHGKMSPFVLDGCEDVTLKNFAVDYAEPMYFEAKILAADEHFVEMEYDDSQFHVDIVGDRFRFFGENWENITPAVLVNEFEPSYKGPTPYTATYFACVGKEKNTSFLGGMYRYLSAEKPAPNRLRLTGELGFCHTPGKYWLCTHNGRHYPGIFITESKRVTLTDITLNHTLAMGVIGQLSEDLTLERIIAEPSAGRMLSVDADATHFVNCSGLLHMKDCRFESMMDDACNVHGIYLPVERKIDARTALLRFGHFQQKGINIFRPGDAIRLVANDTLQPCGCFTVKSSTLISGDYLLLETEEDLPEPLPAGYAFENHTRMPAVHFEGCVSGYNRPRGFLLSTCKPALVENCAFHNMNAAIWIAGDANSWYESGPCTEIVLRNNRFDNAAYAGGAVIVAAPELKTEGAPPYHTNLRVESNFFRLHEKRFMDLWSYDGVVFAGNTYVQDDALPAQKPTGEDGFALRECKNTDIRL
ncbi:MAG: hypothetical protein IJ412_00060 [Oscillospiraceae bacterium]|nr:hypothetical protein [Oscillospiraceae bacterium]